MSVISVQCIDTVLTITDAPILALDGTDSISFSFCSKWDGYTKTVVFRTSPSQSYEVALEDDSALIPTEVLSSSCFCFRVKGTMEGAVDRESDVFRCRVESSELVAEDPALSVHEEIMYRIEQLEDAGGIGSVITDAEIDMILEG